MMMGHTPFWGMMNLIFAVILLLLLIKIVAGLLIMRTEHVKKKKADKLSRENEQRYREAGLSDSDIKIFRQTLAEAKENIETWEGNIQKNDDLDMVDSLTGGLKAAKQTFKFIVQQPQELTKQNELLYKQLPNMVKLSEKYLEMKNEPIKTEESERDLNETLLLFKTLSIQISKNYHDILMDDVKIIKNEVKYD